MSGLTLPVALMTAHRKRRVTNAALRDHPANESVRADPRARVELLEGNPWSVDLRGAMLDGIDLRGRDLSGLDLSGAHLRRAKLAGAKLNGTRLGNADLTGSDLSDADLSGTDLVDAVLIRATLIGANMTSTHHLVMANLKHAQYNRTTSWPVGFDPGAAGATSDLFGPGRR
jgi:uncharacterized protein YjbI with pentapeptide repeats